MLKQTVSYTDFDDNEAIETLYFNLTKSELADNIHLEDELKNLQKMFEEEKRSVTTAEIKRILELVKTFMRLSHGVRSSDGKRFIKTPEQWTEFTQTAAYDAFLFSLFEYPEKAVTFMTGILPADMRGKAQAAADQQMAAVMGSNVSEKAETKTYPSVVSTPLAKPEVVDAEKPKVSNEDIKAYLEANPGVKLTDLK